MAETKARHIANLVEDDGDIKSAHLDNITVTPTAVSDQPNTSIGYLDLPSGTTAQRPTLDNAGGTRYNTTTGSLEFYDGTGWISTNLIPTINSVTGTIYAGLSSTLTLSLTSATDTIDVKYFEGGTLLAADSGVTVSSGSATSTVPSQVYGQTANDTITIQVLNQDGTPSSNNIDKTVLALPSGGTKTGPTGGYFYHTFTSSDTFTNTIASLSVDFLLVAGGGAGGHTYAGGGGAGGAIDGTATLAVQGYAYVQGGAGTATSSGQGGDGGDATWNGNTAIGGGGGGSYNSNSSGRAGGSGGGTASEDDDPTAGAGTAGPPRQGYRGGQNHIDQGNGYAACGGGGYSEQGEDLGSGANSTTFRGSDGGTGINWKSLGTYYADGGGGQAYGGGTTQGPGGSGTGGIGARTSGGTSVGAGNATANRGSGGGGGGAGTAVGGGNGSDGILIVRYQTPA